jgi:hypothetical protein
MHFFNEKKGLNMAQDEGTMLIHQACQGFTFTAMLDPTGEVTVGL